jgi:hypothetical protein
MFPTEKSPFKLPSIPGAESVNPSLQRLEAGSQTSSSIDGIARSILERLHLSPQVGAEAIQSGEQKSIRFVWDCIRAGDSWEWRTKVSDEEIISLNALQSPVDQPTSTILADFFLDGKIDGTNFLNEAQSRFLEELGFLVRFDEDGMVFKTPTKESFDQKYSMLKQKNEELPPLTIVEVDQILDPDQFVELNIKYDLIFSKPPELIHDLFFHVIMKLISIVNAPTEYPGFKLSQNEFFRKWREFLKGAEANPEKALTELTPFLSRGTVQVERFMDMVKLLKYSYSDALDDMSAGYLKYSSLNTKPFDSIVLRIVNLIKNDDLLKNWTREQKIDPKIAEGMVEDFAKNPPTLGEVVLAIMRLNELTLSPRILKKLAPEGSFESP